VAEKVDLINNLHPLDVKPFEKGRVDKVFARAPVKKGRSTLPLFNKWGVRDKNGKMTCATCHDIHGEAPGAAKKDRTAGSGEDEALSTSFIRKPAPEICRECHPDKFSLADSEHDLKLASPEIKNTLDKSPAESELCGGCHLVHGPHKGFLWARETSVNGDNIFLGLCESCHTENGIAKKKVDTGHSHPVNISPSEKGMATTLPLFDHKGKSPQKDVMTCHSCHDPHQPGRDSIKAEKVKETGERKQIAFLRKPSQKICIECHQDKSTIARSKHDLKKVAPDARNVLDQTPSETGLCGNCHLAHNGQQFFLWARDVDIKSDNIVQDICISCHKEEGVAGKKAIKDHSHPVNVSPADKGLSTTLPLFEKNGKSSKEGLMACLTCHEPHRWDPIKKVDGDHYDLEGNAQNSFLRLEATPSPRLCENCHKDKAYIKNTDHDLRVSAPSYRNITGQTPEESGVCGACHLVHNSKNWISLWALELVGRGNLKDMLCNSCHSANGIAKDKIPAVSSHPEEVKMNSTGRNVKGRLDYFPLFHKSYGELIPQGNVSCPSCHDAHQWQAGKTKDNWVNIEGDATNSFLRSRSSILPCKECHGPEALYRYKYFHKAKARKNKTAVPR
jgi:hypothetical protein